MTMELKNKKSPQQIWVEGPDDLHVVAALWKEVQSQEPREKFFLRDAEGYTNLRKILPTILTPDNLGPIGIVVDADQNLDDRWNSIRDRVQEIGYQLPSEVQAEGVIVDHESLPKVGIWIWPDNQNEGILEDFLHQIIKSEDELIPEVHAVLEKIKGKERFTAVKRPKALIHTWLAWQEEPGYPFGKAITSHYLDLDHSLCPRFVAWLDRLFYIDPNLTSDL